MQDALKARLPLALLLVLLVAARSEPADPRFLSGAWAMGYAGEVERACPKWRRVPAPELARRGLLDPATRATGWGYEGALHASFWKGAEAAQRDRAAHPDFCVHPARFRRSAPITKVIELAE